MCNTFSNFPQHFCGNRNNIHHRICPTIMFARLDNLYVDFFNQRFRFYKLFDHLFANRHLPIDCDVIVFSPLHFIHVVGFNHKTSQIFYLFLHNYYTSCLMYLLYQKSRCIRICFFKVLLNFSYIFEWQWNNLSRCLDFY